MGYFADDAGFAVRSSLRGLRFAGDPTRLAEDRSPLMSLLIAAIGATVTALHLLRALLLGSRDEGA